MARRNEARTIGELKASGYKPVPLREEMRRNLLSMIRDKQDLFPGIIGYEGTVIPQIENAVIAGQDVIFLGERGQAKSRIMRMLINLLDEYIPVIKGCEINDDPLDPLCRACRDLVAQNGDATEISWLHRDERYGEKLATPDITIADLIGDVDPIKVAEGRYLSDELTIHYGMIPRSNRGIFCINELPDLTERLQVGLFNLMEENDIQIRGYRVRLPLDILLVSSANPDDYTNRGRIITPLKDRYGSQIRTHYPLTVEDEIAIIEQERRSFGDEGVECYVPKYMKEIIAEITHLGRRSPDINQRSGVSVRVSIANYESMISNAIRRAVTVGEKLAVPRISDLPFILASTMGKIELESFEDTKEDKIVDDLTKKAVFNVFNNYFKTSQLEPVVTQFNSGFSVEISDAMPAKSYVRNVKEIVGLTEAVKVLNDSERPEAIAAAMEFVLEGLHLNKRLNKTRSEGKTVYRR
ncbi:MAG: magnesium chelatase [Chloroflexi bacterium]|nr:magnesium chelatase [Chloroflexota bacterium]